MPHVVKHGDVVLGEIATLDDVRRLRDRIRGSEYQWGVVSNALDVVIDASDAPLAYLSPRDRRMAEAEIVAIRTAIETVRREPSSRPAERDDGE